MSSARARAFPANEAARVFCAAEYGWYSNANRGKRRKAQGGESTTIEEFTEVSGAAAKRAWARLIKQGYEVDPLVCPRCAGAMRLIAFIEQPDVIAKILTHLGLWPARVHRPPAGYPLPDSLQRVALAAERSFLLVGALGRHPPRRGRSRPVARATPVCPCQPSPVHPILPPNGRGRSRAARLGAAGGLTGRLGRDRRAAPKRKFLSPNSYHHHPNSYHLSPHPNSYHPPSSYFNEPLDSVNFGIHQGENGFWAGWRVDVAAHSLGSGVFTYLETIGYLPPGPEGGIFTARIRKIGSQVSFEILDTSPAISVTIPDIATAAPFLSPFASRIFFGNASCAYSYGDLRVLPANVDLNDR